MYPPRLGLPASPGGLGIRLSLDVSEESPSELESDSASDGREVRSEYPGVRVRKRTVGDFITGEVGATDGIRLGGATDGIRPGGATDDIRLGGAADDIRLVGGATDGIRLGGATDDRGVTGGT